MPLSGSNSNLDKLQQTHDLCVSCRLCCTGHSDISYFLRPITHQCSKCILLVKTKGSHNKWKHVAPRPNYPNPSKYTVCYYYNEGLGCSKHGPKCSFARSPEEAAVWNFMKTEGLDLPQLISRVDNGYACQSQQEEPSVQLPGAAQEIFCSLQGTFMELCKTCFHDSPQKISPRDAATPCASRHGWKPVLVYCHMDKKQRVTFDEIRPLPKRNAQQWKYCKYLEKGEPCWHGKDRCWFAHSEAEMAVWQSECRQSLDRSALLQTGGSRAMSDDMSQKRERQHYCHVCKCQFFMPEDFMNHCFTVKHRRLIFEYSPSTWKHREPPLTSKTFVLCERMATCEYGDSCMDAHSVEELQEWTDRHKATRRKARAAAKQGLLSYQDALLEEYRLSEHKEMIMKPSLPGVSVSCDSDLSVFIRQENISHRWTFKITSKVALKAVALLRQDLRAAFAIGADSREERSYSDGIWFNMTHHDTPNKQDYEIIVSFTSTCSGMYEQWLVFDFDMRPVLRKILRVRVGQQLLPEYERERTQQSSDTSIQILEPENTKHSKKEPVVWQEGTVEIIPYGQRSKVHHQLLERYRNIKQQLNIVSNESSGAISRQNYKKKMHSFLYQEEMAEDQLVGRLNLRGKMTFTKSLYNPWFGLKYAIPGELFASVSVSHSLTPNTPEGYMLKRHVQTVLIGLSKPEGGLQRVYEAVILKDTLGDKELHLLLSEICCTELKLETDKTVEMEVQFQLDRIWFCEMHKAIDDLPDLRRVLPDLSDRNVQVPRKSDLGQLNEKQQTAMNFIIGASEHRSGCTVPLLIYGPFGTGKTYTLAKITLVLTQRPQNKILICTHTNSSADLYVKDHFHRSVSTTDNHPARPLRIKAKEISLRTTDQTTLQYCHISKDGLRFEFPDRNTLDAARIIITTTAVSRFFHDMQLPPDYFTHIFIDEASQMLECEALMALGLAGEKTQVVLAGDHMQMGPKLFSVGEDKRSDYTLLNRLFHYYQAENNATATNSRIIFNENYRSTKEIVDFVSTYFYVGKQNVIKAKGNILPHPYQYALQFYHTRGECYMDEMSLSWFNPTQIQTVVEIVYKVLNDWPPDWTQDSVHKSPQNSICVLSQGSQVFEIRKRLKDYKLNDVIVENAENVQGKQFRVIIITTVHTKDSLKSIENTCLEFFNDMRVLNTAMTRAQSQVIVVGDAAALCCSHFGKCWRLWTSYIRHCIDRGSVFPDNFTLDYLNQELLEISNIIEAETDDSSDDESIASEMSDIQEDPILKELLNEDSHLQIKLTEEGLFPVLRSDNLDKNVVRHEKEDNPPVHSQLMWQNNSSIYRRCELTLERYDMGYAKPLDEPTLRIDIKGRKNLGRSFSGAVVMVEILTTDTVPQQGKVVEVVYCEASSKEFVCTIDNNDDQVMVPINICVPKLYTPFWKDKPYHIAVRNPENWTVERFVKINEEARRNILFVVKFLKWRSRFHYPLGIVIKTLPRVTSLQNGLEVLDAEYQLKKPVPLCVQQEVERLEYVPNTYTDFSKVMTFTIDPTNSQDLDDAISVRDLGQNYEIGIHIADVAGFVAKDSELDKYARQQGTAFYVSEAEPTYMFPKNVATDVFSLLPNCKRYCISLLTQVDKQTHQIKQRRFCNSAICSKKKLSYQDAEDILKTSGNETDFNSLEGCVAIAYTFAEVHRKHRKHGDWCYNPPDEDEVFGRRRSHILVEELMIMFNHAVADRLLTDKQAMSLTPLRCQDRPDRDKLLQFLHRHSSYLPMSIHLYSQLSDYIPETDKQTNQNAIQQTVDTDQEVSVLDSESFPILTSVLKNLETAALNQDIYKIIDLISTDDIHPQLLPIVMKLRKLTYKAHVLRANTTHFSRIGHYDLELDSYTWASSPIRRYIDVIVQRLLHFVLDKTEIKYSSSEIDMCCVEFAQKSSNQSVCEKKSHALSFASKLSIQNERKVAYIVELTPAGNNFRIAFPLNRTSIPEKVDVMYRDLQLADQPLYDEENKCMVLKWVRRVYSFSSPSIHTELKQQEANNLITHVPTESWEGLVAAIREENWDFIVPMIDQLKTGHPRQSVRREKRVPALRTEASTPKEEHNLELSLKLKQGEIIEIQLGTDTSRGLMVPAAQLLIVNSKFEICMEHAKNPVMCFSKHALYSSRSSYNTYMDYQKIWKPLCEMESAASAVAENESIVIVDATLQWRSSKEGLQGSFNLPLEKKAQWAIEGNLRNCFLCIRSRVQQKDFSSVLEDPHTNAQDLDLMEVPDLIWIAHGTVTKVSGEEESKELTYMEIDFRINHMPMMKIPESILCSTAKFTVELIPKLLPDVRKENAIDNLTAANQLVKAIATGKKTRNQRTQRTEARYEIEDHLNLGFPLLNNSQCKAINEALNNEFTLIQGPPGTGKTVVGVHIVYWFFQRKQEHSSLQKGGNKEPKKKCILYCGPSNKSVDVVAGQLLKLQHKLKPLRVYSDQMEIQEFPYPGSNLKLSRHSQRVEKPNKDIRSITLHHRIRMPTNPFSDQIKAYDLRIQKEESLTDDEIESYKNLLRKARKHELVQHDVILCTCTAASHPILVHTLSFEQIIIDECAMATEPEALIPLTAHKPEQIVLLGDHKQLQPVVHSEMFQRLGMGKSLFERYMKKALMLDIQYRMQEDICEFPSEAFYEAKLKTGIRYRPGLFLNSLNRPTSIIFGHVKGKEIGLVVSTERGNENSKANLEEAEVAVQIALRLTKAKVPAKEIAILTPYNAQVAKIKESLKLPKSVTVNTIMKSQGSEWRYVILSTVRCCPMSDIEEGPTKAWLKKKLGFVTDPHQVNVAITRAQEGLCIIGNKDLLRCSFLWRKLLLHYQSKGCVVDRARDIKVSVT